MSTIKRSLKSVQGDITVNEGDVTITDKDNGIVLTNQSDVLKRVTVVTDAGQDTLKIEDA